MTRTWWTICLFWTVLMASAQDRTEFSVQVDDNEPAVGEYFNISFVLNASNGKEFSPPDFGDFEVVSGPSHSSITTMRNGKISGEVKYSYGLLPVKKGTFIIPAASIKVGKRRYQTSPVRITVVEKKSPTVVDANGAPIDDPFFVRAELSQDTIYVGQQIKLDFKLYTRIDIENYTMHRPPELKDFYVRNYRRLGRSRQETINGVTYVTKVMRSMALFPQKSGAFTIEPAIFQLGTVPEGSRQHGFFKSFQLKTEIVSSNELTLHVQPVPDNAPEDFTGAVGNFQAEASISSKNITTDGAFAISLQVTGDGDVRRVLPPVLDFGPDFEVYEPQILKEEDHQGVKNFVCDKIFEYQVVPLKAGAFQLVPAFTYFDPDTSRYITVYADTFKVDVRQGSGNRFSQVTREDSELSETGTLRYIRASAHLRKQRRPMWASPVHMVLLGCPFILFVGLLGHKRQWWSSKETISAEEKRRLEALRIATERLDSARSFMANMDVRGFYDALSKALLGYASDKIQIPVSDLSKSNIREKLQAESVEASAIDRMVELLETCERAVYGASDGGKMDGDYESAKQLISELENKV